MSTASDHYFLLSARRALVALGLAALVASALIGGNAFGLRDTLSGSAAPSARPVALSPFVSVGTSDTGPSSVFRSEPWWQGVARLSGAAGTTTSRITIGASAIQWRVRWRCARGSLVVRTGATARLIGASCPAAGSVSDTITGPTKLVVAATGSWSISVDQQVDTPLVNPPLAAMTAPGAAIVETGRLQRIDQFATGRVTIYRLADGGYAIRLASLYVTPNIDLEIRLSPLSSPRTTHQYLSEPSAYVAPLDITAGSLNFSIPTRIDPTAYHSVVIWCPLVRSAYAGAPMSAAQ